MVLTLRHEGGADFHTLDDRECLRLLGQASLGRVAVSVGALPAVFPVNYAVHDGAIYFRTDPGTKLAAACRGAAVAFQVDSLHLHHQPGWSIQALGVAKVVGSDAARELLAVMALEPWAPGPHEYLVGINPEFLWGQRIGFP